MAVTSPYDGLTPEAIKAEMLADLQVKGVDVDHREGSYANTLVSVAARMPTASAARSWSCISAISGETTTQQPSIITAGN